MTTTSSNANVYKQQQILTASPEKLILMLYNGFLKFTNEAIVAIEDNNIEKAHNSCIRAQDIVCELMASLDMDYEISKELLNLYEYVEFEIVEANLKKDKKHLENAKMVITNIREGWVEAMKIAREDGNLPENTNMQSTSVISV